MSKYTFDVALLIDKSCSILKSCTPFTRASFNLEQVQLRAIFDRHKFKNFYYYIFSSMLLTDIECCESFLTYHFVCAELPNGWKGRVFFFEAFSCDSAAQDLHNSNSTVCSIVSFFGRHSSDTSKGTPFSSGSQIRMSWFWTYSQPARYSRLAQPHAKMVRR